MVYGGGGLLVDDAILVCNKAGMTSPLTTWSRKTLRFMALALALGRRGLGAPGRTRPLALWWCATTGPGR